MADPRQASCPEVSGALFSALLEGDLPRSARAVFFIHAQGCGACQQRLLTEAPELLLAAAAENFSAPEPLDLPRLLSVLPERTPLPLPTRTQYWQIAAMLLILLGGGALLLRKAMNPGGAPGVEIARKPGSSVAPAIIAPVETAAAIIGDQPAIESGADEFQIREYEAPGFDGKTAQWVRLTPADEPAVAAGEVRS